MASTRDILEGHVPEVVRRALAGCGVDEPIVEYMVEVLTDRLCDDLEHTAGGIDAAHAPRR